MNCISSRTTSSISSRIARQGARIRDSVCPHTIANLVASMTAELDPEAIPALIGLLDHTHDAKDSVGRALLRYGEAAEESIRAAAKASAAAEYLLDRMAYRARLRELGCF
jgi:hypothetical protein